MKLTDEEIGILLWSLDSYEYGELASKQGQESAKRRLALVRSCERKLHNELVEREGQGK